MMSFSNYLNEDKMGLVVCVQYGVILSRGLPCTSIKPESSFFADEVSIKCYGASGDLDARSRAPAKHFSTVYCAYAYFTALS